jgi:tetratricopeptide (TPR) repeat protein
MDNLFEEHDDGQGFGHEWEQAERLAEEAFDLYEKGQMQQAFEKLTQAVQKGPGNAAWFFNMGLTLDGMDQYEQAITCYEKALEVLPDDAEIMNCLGVDYTRTAQYDLALATFEGIEQSDPLFEPAYCNRIITYTEMEQHDKAEQMFYLAQQIHSDCPLCFYNIGNSLFSRGVYERAIWCWEKTAALDPGHPQINFRLAQAYWVCGKGRQARQAFLKEIRKTPADLEVLLEFGIFQLESGDLGAAKEKFNRILEFDPDFAAARFYLGEVYRLRGDVDAAAKQYRAALSGDGQLPGPRFRLAQLLRQQGQTDPALVLLKAECRLDVQDVDVLVAMGGMFTQMNDSENAAKCFLQALDLEHEDPRAFSGLGVALALRGEYAGGRQCLEQSLRLNDDNPMTLLNAAWMCCRLEDWEAAGVYAARSQSLSGSREPYRSACKSIEEEVRRNSREQPYARLLTNNVSGLIKRAGFGLFR